jgi:protoporphyrinogen oxidase
VPSSNADVPVAIIGAGLSGLSTSYHLDHRDGVRLFEWKDYYGGHVHSETREGFTWDDGPHISFTSNEYVKSFFADAVDGEFEDLDIKAVNYYQGHWIDHPAQTSLYQVPEPLRSRCVESFIEMSKHEPTTPRNYQEWLHQTMGPVFADTFPAAYTRKYWTTDPKNLDVDWIGMRILRPDVEDVIKGAEGPMPRTMYYVNTRPSRYPSKGGFVSYLHKLAKGANISYGMEVEQIDFAKQVLRFTNGSEVTYGKLVTTMPLPSLIERSVDVPDDVREAATMLRSTRFYRIDVAVNHPPTREELWYYIYDEDKLCVRLSVTERFAPSNAPEGKTGIQVEVYGSAFKPLPEDIEHVKRQVVAELLEMGLVKEPGDVQYVQAQLVPTGQIVYDLNRRDVLKRINPFLNEHGVIRVGRYSEWKYLMTDACLLGGRRAANQINGAADDTDWDGVAITKDDVPDEEQVA